MSDATVGAGGALLGIGNANVTKRPFKKHGRWRSESAKDGYVNYSVERN